MKPRGVMIKRGGRLPVVEAKAKRLTNDAMTKMIPMYVHGTGPDDDHKCGNCNMRVEEGQDAGTGLCTIVEGTISLAAGTCAYWARGETPAKSEQQHDEKMTQLNAGYAEYKGAVQCSTCKFFEDGYCKLWMGTVKPGDCCMAYDAPDMELRG